MGERFKQVKIDRFLWMVEHGEFDGEILVFRDGGGNQITIWDFRVSTIVSDHSIANVRNNLCYGDLVVFNINGIDNYIISG